MRRAWSASWLTQTSARPAGSAASQSPSNPSTAAVVAGSSEAVGSSSRSTAGSSCKARTSPTSWASPPERSRLLLARKPRSRPSRARRSSARPASNARSRWAASVKGCRRLSSTRPLEQGGPLVEVDHLLAISGHGLAPHGAAVPADRALIERVEQGHGPQQHGLPRARRPEDAQPVAEGRPRR